MRHRKTKRKRRRHMSGVTVGRTHGRKHSRRRMRGITVGGITVGSHRKHRRKKKHFLSGIGAIADPLMRQALRILGVATGFFLGKMVRNNSKFGFPKFAPNITSPLDLVIIGGVGLGVMYWRRKADDFFYYVGLGITAFAATEAVLEFVPGIAGITEYDISGIENEIERNIGHLRQEMRHGEEISGITVGAGGEMAPAAGMYSGRGAGEVV